MSHEAACVLRSQCVDANWSTVGDWLCDILSGLSGLVDFHSHKSTRFVCRNSLYPS